MLRRLARRAPRLVLALVLLVAGPGRPGETARGPGYAPAPPAAVTAAPRAFAGRRVIVSGRVAALAPGDRLVRGVLAGPRARLAFEGERFDWRPSSGQAVDLWGVIRLRGDEPYLLFHNGRPRGDEGRRPRPTPPLRPGRAVALVGRLVQVGSEPLARLALVTEDRVTVTLTGAPSAGARAGGLVRVRGVVERVSPIGPTLRVRSLCRLPEARSRAGRPVPAVLEISAVPG